MAEKKNAPEDVYAAWLSVPSGPRPPDHYTLLGLARFESDPKKISEASSAGLRKLRPISLKYPVETNALMNEIAAAEVCLLDAEAKAKYDERLRAGSNAKTAAAAQATVVAWYIERAGQVFGPFPEHQLREMARAGYVARRDQVWNEQLGNWVAAETIKGLEFKDGSNASEETEGDLQADEVARLRSAVEMHARRLIPYNLGGTQLTPGEFATLAAAGVKQRAASRYAAWRRTHLVVLAILGLLIGLYSAGATLLDTDLMRPNLLGHAVRGLRLLSFFALPIAAAAAAAVWANLRLSRGILLAGGLLGTLVPLLLALIPFPMLLADPFFIGELQAHPGATAQVFRILVVVLAIAAAGIRAALWSRSLRPGTPIATWSLRASAAGWLFVAWIALAILTHLVGNGLLMLAAPFLIGGPLAYFFAERWLDTGDDAQRRRTLLAVRGVDLLVFGIGAFLALVFLTTRILVDGGSFRLVGFDPETSLFRPGIVLQFTVEFLFRSYFTSIVFFDFLETIAQRDGKTGETRPSPAA